MNDKKPFRKVFTENASRKGIGIFVVAILVISVFAAMSPTASAATQEEIDNAIDDGIVWLLS
jgi:hypothetical protein